MPEAPLKRQDEGVLTANPSLLQNSARVRRSSTWRRNVQHAAELVQLFVGVADLKPKGCEPRIKQSKAGMRRLSAQANSLACEDALRARFRMRCPMPDCAEFASDHNACVRISSAFPDIPAGQ